MISLLTIHFSWYLSIDFQFYIFLGPALAMVAAWNMLSGMILATCLLIASMAYTFIFSMRGHWAISYLTGGPFERMTMDCKLC